MTLPKWERTITDASGNTQTSGVSITVRSEITGAPLAALFSDRDGTVPLSNPFNADSEGVAKFFVASGAYRLDIVTSEGTRTLRYEAIGLAAETDGVPVGAQFRFATETADADPGSGYLRFDNADPNAASTLYVSYESVKGTDVSSYLFSFDDGGETSDRGRIFIANETGEQLFLGTVTGSITDATTYVKISVTPIFGPENGDLIAGQRLGLFFIAAPVPSSVFDGNGIDINPGSDTDADLITVGVTGSPKIQWDESADAFRVTNPIVVDRNGNGDVTHTINGTAVTSEIELHSEGADDLGGLTIHRHTDNNNFGGHLIFLRSDGDHASPGVPDDGDTLGRIISGGYDGTDYHIGAEIRFTVDGTPGSNDMPTEMQFRLNGTLVGKIRDGGALELEHGSVYASEQANAAADITAYGQWWVRDDAPNTPMFTDDAGNDRNLVLEAIIVPCSDENSDLTTGAPVRTFRMPFAIELTDIKASVTTAPTGSSLIADVNVGGSTIMTTDKLEIEAGDSTTEDAATQPALTTTSIAADAEVTIDIDQIGSTVAGTGLKVTLIGYRTDT